MPSKEHEALVQLFRHRPSFAAELLAHSLGIEVPKYQEARIESAELTDLIPTEYRADLVVVLTCADAPVLAVVVEAQLSRDLDKRWTWPVYLATLRARLRCPTVLLVVCVNTRTAAWSAAPIVLGHPGWILSPLVLGPDRVPLVTDAAEASRTPELAVLSAMAHTSHPDLDKILHAVVGAFASVDPKRSMLYSDIVFAALPQAARLYLEALMSTGTYEYKSDFVRRYFFQGRAEGLAQGEANAVLAVLDARGIEVPDDARARILECTDIDQLDKWVRRAATAHSISELFH